MIDLLARLTFGQDLVVAASIATLVVAVAARWDLGIW
jgi:hypothetical protein